VSVAAFALEIDVPAPIAITQQSVMSESNFLITGSFFLIVPLFDRAAAMLTIQVFERL
jgi:hypothetical protein